MNELSFADNLALKVIDSLKELEDENFLVPSFPIKNFEYMCTKVSKEHLDKGKDILKEAAKKLSLFSAEFHKIAYEFEAASNYVAWLETKNLAFGYEKSLAGAAVEEVKDKNSKDFTEALTDEQALKMVEMLKGRFGI